MLAPFTMKCRCRFGWYIYYYTRRMQMSTSVFKIWRKSPRPFVIPLQSSRKFVLRLDIARLWTAHLLRLSFAFLRKTGFTLQFSRCRHAHCAHATPTARTAPKSSPPFLFFTVIRPTPFATCPSLGHPSQGSGKKHCALRLPSLGDQDRSPRSGNTIEPIGL